MNKQLSQLKRDLKKLQRPEKAKLLNRFFKTGKGEYAEGDRFLGLNTAETVNTAKKYLDLGLPEIACLLSSNTHEERVAALVILKTQFNKSDNKGKEIIFHFYLHNLQGINNWDLVDSSAPVIIGNFLLTTGGDIDLLKKMANSENLWYRRIAIMATFAYIKKNQFKPTLTISKILLNDKQDLIHKAVGWLLREIGKRDNETEEIYLKSYYRQMPRTMLRYAIEKFPEIRRQQYLKGQV